MTELNNFLEEIENRKENLSIDEMKLNLEETIKAKMSGNDIEVKDLSQKLISKLVPEVSLKVFFDILMQATIMLNEKYQKGDKQLLEPLVDSLSIIIMPQAIRISKKMGSLNQSIESLKNLMTGSSDPVVSDGCVSLLNDVENILKEF